MQCGCGVEVAVVTAKIANRENMNAWFHVCSAVAEWLAVAVQIFFTPWSDLCHCHRASTAESGCGLHSHQFFYFSSDLCEQLSMFPRSWQLWCRMAYKNTDSQGKRPCGGSGNCTERKENSQSCASPEHNMQTAQWKILTLSTMSTNLTLFLEFKYYTCKFVLHIYRHLGDKGGKHLNRPWSSKWSDFTLTASFVYLVSYFPSVSVYLHVPPYFTNG